MPVRPHRVQASRSAFARTQVPLALAFGVTVHKSQGLTLHQGSVLHLEKGVKAHPVNEPGMCFVGSTRTKEFAMQGYANVPPYAEFAGMRKALAEKHALAMQAGLTIKQINDWFTNYRKRHWEQELVKAQALDFDDHSASSGSS